MTARYWRGAAPFGRREPQFTLNGNAVPSVGWGRTVLPVLPGRHFLHVEIPGKGRFGSARGLADTVIDVHPGRLVELEYRAPLAEPIVRGIDSPRGALGPAPQQYNGVGNLVLAVAMLMLFAVVFGMPLVFWVWERYFL